MSHHETDNTQFHNDHYVFNSMNNAMLYWGGTPSDRNQCIQSYHHSYYPSTKTTDLHALLFDKCKQIKSINDSSCTYDNSNMLTKAYLQSTYPSNLDSYVSLSDEPGCKNSRTSPSTNSFTSYTDRLNGLCTHVCNQCGCTN